MNKKYSKKLPKDASVPELGFGHDGGLWVSVTDLLPDPDNDKIFTFDNEELNDLAEDITDHGLVEPIELYKGTLYMVSGHRRWIVSKTKLGFTHLPVTLTKNERPDSQFERIEQLRSRNFSRKQTFSQNFKGMEASVDAWQEEHSPLVPDDDFITKQCKFWKVDKADWNKMIEMKRNYPDYYSKARSGELGPRQAHKEATYSPPTMKSGKSLKDLLSDADIDFLVNSLYNTEKKILDINELRIVGGGTPGQSLASLDENTYSTLLHGTACAWLATQLNNSPSYSDDWWATNNQDRLHDVFSERDNTGLEVKVRTITGNQQPRFEINNFSPGLHVLIAKTPDFSAIFMCSTHLTLEHVKPISAGRYAIKPESFLELFKEGRVQVHRGTVEDSNGKPFVRLAPTHLSPIR